MPNLPSTLKLIQLPTQLIPLRTLALAAALATAGSAVAADPLALGAEMPAADVEMKSVDGETVTLAEAGGERGTLVIFTCNACPWAKAWEERIVALGNRFNDNGVGVVAVNPNDPNRVAADSYEEMIERAKDRGMKFPYVVDATSNVARAFGATRTPEAFLFDADGKLVYHGTIDDNAEDPKAVNKAYLADALSAVTAGKPVPVKQTKALGCSIKFRPEA